MKAVKASLLNATKWSSPYIYKFLLSPGHNVSGAQQRMVNHFYPYANKGYTHL